MFWKAKEQFMYPRKTQHFRNSRCFRWNSVSRASLTCWYILKTGQLWFSNRRWDLLTTQPEGDFCCNISEVKRHMKEEFDPAMSEQYCHQLYHKQTNPSRNWGFSVPFHEEKTQVFTFESRGQWKCQTGALQEDKQQLYAPKGLSEGHPT